MSALPNEISFDITNFLPNDDVTDLMLVSRNFNALVTPRLQKINEAKKRMKDIFQSLSGYRYESLVRVKERMSLERFDDATFLHILSALLSKPEFRQEYNISQDVAGRINYICTNLVIYQPLSNFTNP
ncbi:hypothetical protein Ddc_12004 [Ditylenchus destructor]|nr:hypothetical protein Ddc_12004 [Ditylenchus destructor]